jgi:hypothetical protein
MSNKQKIEYLVAFSTVWLFCFNHRINIPTYAIEQQCWQSGVPKNEMSLMSIIFKNSARSLAKCGTMWLFFNNSYLGHYVALF